MLSPFFQGFWMGVLVTSMACLALTLGSCYILDKPRTPQVPPDPEKICAKGWHIFTKWYRKGGILQYRDCTRCGIQDVRNLGA